MPVADQLPFEGRKSEIGNGKHEALATRLQGA